MENNWLFSNRSLNNVQCNIRDDLLYSFILPYAIQKLKKNKIWFYKESNIIVIPNFIFKIRSKAKTLILLTLLTAGTLAIFSSTLLTLYYPVAATERIAPSAIEFLLDDKDVANKALQTVQNTVGKENTRYTETTIINGKSNSNNLPKEYRIKKNMDLTLSLSQITES